ncbi:NACHT, LRR and PYD domains-containing protein 1a-like isoform X2 [Danio aesculapii]|uniref:NACHT, LRR and PYD domains-containing protein 1a-like isoform X2 n=1 Tax=Danio aesculapii TaxID=1142201 RepID=UPI0024BFE33C|nr:NACHT, LRR and PYD domains-containing protein 1a-like isoform X2 [Danio aesculapii]
MSILCSSEDQGKNPLQAAIDEYAAIKKLMAEASARRKLEAAQASKGPEDSEDEGECTSDAGDEGGMRISLPDSDDEIHISLLDSDDESTWRRRFRHPRSLGMGTRTRTVKRYRNHGLQASKKTETGLEQEEECTSDPGDEGDSDDEIHISLPDSDDESTWRRRFRHPRSLGMGTRTRTVKRYRNHGLHSSKKTETGLKQEEGAESSSGQTPSDDAKIFTPELIQEDDKYKDKNTYRFVCPHAGQFQCSLTSLVFVMEGEGELLYRVVSWDPCLLDGLGQMQPAGPLYDVNCFNGSISKLNLPHCEIFSEGDNRDGLAVAHFTGGNMEIIQPIKVTESHVMIDIRVLSLFGLLWMKIFSRPCISGQVLLFLRTLPVEEEEEEDKILNVHLLPGNVPVTEVLHSHQDKKYIETTSKCHLFFEREYSLRCQPENCQVQPKSEIFEHNNFGPNYHPTFEVFLSVHVKKVGLTILDKAEDCKEVWSRPRILLKAPSQGVEPPEHRMISGSEFVDALRDKLIQRVSSVMAIADSLKSKHMIADELYSELQNADTNQSKMRCLFKALHSGGASVKAEFYRLLKKNEPHLVEELESGPSRSRRRQ